MTIFAVVFSSLTTYKREMMMVFRKLSENEILERIEQRKMEIRNLEKLPPLDKFYLSFISKYEGIEITPDIEIFEYEKALNENRYLATNYEIISKKVWIIGASGQGDRWFINKENNFVVSFCFLCRNLYFALLEKEKGHQKDAQYM